MSDNAGKLSLARKFWRIACVMITCIGVQISKLENKAEITHNDFVIIQGHTEKLKSLASEFKKHHFTIIELVDEEDLETLEQEQAQLDNHEDNTTKVI